MLRILVRRSATLVLVTTVVFVAAAFSGGADLEGQPAGNLAGPATTTGFTDPTVPGQLTARLVDGPPAPALSRTSAGTSTTTTTTVGGTVDGVDGPASVAGPGAVTPTTSPPPADGQPDQGSAATPTTAAPAPPTSSGSGMYLWDTVWQIAAKANADGMDQYVGRLAAAGGNGGANVTGFLFSVVNINQDINTPNGFGHTFGSFAAPNQDYLNDVETLIAKAAGRDLRVGIVAAWDGPNQFSVESGKLNADNAYQYGYTIASQWTRPDFGARWAVSAWVLGGDTTMDNGGEHGAVWAEVARGITDAETDNGFWGAPILFHTAPGQQLHYLGSSWLHAHSPQTGHCADTGTAVAWMNELAATGARVWGNAEARYEDIAWNCNGGVPISPDQVLADAVAMGELGFMANFVFGHDDRWNASWPGSHGLSSGGGTSEGLQRILDEPGLIRPRS